MVNETGETPFLFRDDVKTIYQTTGKDKSLFTLKFNSLGLKTKVKRVREKELNTYPDMIPTVRTLQFVLRSIHVSFDIEVFVDKKLSLYFHD